MEVYIRLPDIDGESADKGTADADSFDFVIEPDVDPIALLLPAVQAARDVGDQSTHSNLKQLSVACHYYEDVPDDGQLTLAVEDWPA